MPAGASRGSPRNSAMSMSSARRASSPSSGASADGGGARDRAHDRLGSRNASMQRITRDCRAQRSCAAAAAVGVARRARGARLRGGERRTLPSAGRGLRASPRRAPERALLRLVRRRAGDGVLYFGEAAFWSAMARLGRRPDRRPAARRPAARSAASTSPRERWLPPLEVGGPAARLRRLGRARARRTARSTSPTFFERPGSVDPATGRVRRASTRSAGR